MKDADEILLGIIPWFIGVVLAVVVAVIVWAIATHYNPPSKTLGTVESNNPKVSVGLVVEFDGVKLYQVEGLDHPVYVAVRQDNVSTSWTRTETHPACPPMPARATTVTEQSVTVEQ